jgi:hypothetical protein
MPGEWPADAEAVAAARQFIDAVSGRVVVASHNDADGLSAAVIAMRALGKPGVIVEPLPARRGEHVHRDAMRERIASLRPDALIVLDMGTRPAPIVEGLPTLVIDHHDASGGIPPGVIMVNGCDREPVAPSSVLAYQVCRHVSGLEHSKWLAAFGAVADLGTAAPFASLLDLQPRGSAWSKAVALVNAARRAPEDDALTALRVLESATSVHDIVDGRVPGVERLRAYSKAVQAEVARCSRVPPRMYGVAALIRFSSGAQVHPIVATRWARRLAPAVVIAANEGFILGRVNFAVRSHSRMNLLEWLRRLPFSPSPSAEYANGHPRATGGSLEPDDFGRFVEALLANGRGRHEAR